MAATGKFWHNPVAAINVAATNAYVLAQSHNINLYSDTAADKSTTPMRGHLGGLYISVDTIAAGATSLTIRLCRDAAGDVTVLGDTLANLSTGITTAAKGSVTYKLDIPYVHTDANLFLFWKTNAGTCQVRSVDLTWSE